MSSISQLLSSNDLIEQNVVQFYCTGIWKYMYTAVIIEILDNTISERVSGSWKNWFSKNDLLRSQNVSVGSQAFY